MLALKPITQTNNSNKNINEIFSKCFKIIYSSNNDSFKIVNIISYNFI
jgi:hypothetical protein